MVCAFVLVCCLLLSAHVQSVGTGSHYLGESYLVSELLVSVVFLLRTLSALQPSDKMSRRFTHDGWSE